MNIRRVALMCVMLVGGTAMAALQFHSPRQPPPPPISIVIARIQTPHSGLLHLAEAKGHFAEAGLATTMQVTPTGYDAIGAVVTGRADVGAAAETPIARALDEGKQIKVIATIFTSTRNAGIVARRDRGIVQPADLKAKRIGFVFGTATHYLLETFLAFNSIPQDSVVLVPIKSDGLLSAIVSGDLDAVASWNPSFAQAQQQLGDKGTTFSSAEFYAETYNLFVRSDYAGSHREEIDRLLHALLKAEVFARTHMDESIDIITSMSSTDPRLFRDHWDPRIYEVTLSQSLLLATENEARWCLRRGLVSNGQLPNILNAFETEPLRAIKPSGVSIVK
jgi:ABC-type nitrate/sulfonate/bicarbonate transport system substrate-binding protein